MGCDIHAHVELMLADGQWHHWTAPYIQRYYRLFEKLAGVRAAGEEVPFSSPRGVPQDISVLTRTLYEDDLPDSHSASWISREEILRLESWWWKKDPNSKTSDARNTFNVAIMGNYAGGSGYGEDLPKWAKDVRLVFWFDN